MEPDVSWNLLVTKLPQAIQCLFLTFADSKEFQSSLAEIKEPRYRVSSELINMDLELAVQEGIEESVELLLRNKNITSVPKTLLVTKKLQKLDLSQNDIQEVTEQSLKGCSKLTYLDLSSNPLRHFPNIYAILTSLTYLNLANCDNLKWLPINVGAISALKELYLPCEGMISPPHEVVVSGSTATLDYSRGIWRGYLTGHVEILRTCLRQVPQEILSSNWAVIPAHCYDIMFPTGVGLLSKLSSLDCSMNKIQMIPFSICRMISLTKLNLADNAVCHIPSSLHMLTNLTHFDLSKNRLHELGEAFFETTSLKTLYLQENQLKIISDSLQKLVLLIRCSLAQNLLYELPHTITSLINLSSFDVNTQPLTRFPFGFGFLTNLKDLSYSKCELMFSPPRELWRAPTWVTMSYLSALDIAKTLDHLIMVSIGLKSIPEVVWNECCHVQILNLSHNFLDNIPDSIQTMQQLTLIDISYNKLQRLPDALTTLIDLVSIDFSFNYISELNKHMGVLERLTSLRARQCKIKLLPESICMIKNLKCIDLSGNTLSRLPNDFTKLYQLELLVFDPSELGAEYGGEEFDKSVKKAHVPAEVALKGSIAIKSHMERMRLARSTGILSLKGLGLRNIPEDVWTLSFLTDLNLTRNRFYEVSSSIKNLEFLKRLSLNSCPEALYLPPELSLCSRLTSISAMFSPNLIIPCQPISNSAKDTLIYLRQILDAPKTQKLDYSNVNEDYTMQAFTGLPLEILKHNLTSITVLKLPESSINDAGVQEFTVLKNLTDLALLDMKLTKLPHVVFSSSTNITSLDLSGNILREINHNIGMLRHILELRFIQCQLTNISSEIGRCTTLQSLVLTDNNLNSLPDEIGNLEDLDFLVLDRNFFETLPSSVRKLSTLTELSLVQNHLKLLPWELADLTQLEILSFSGNPNCRLPPKKYRQAPLPDILNILYSVDSCQVSRAFSLNETSLDARSFGEICSFITNITDLNISFNEVEEFSLEVKLLTSLTKINVSNNLFEELNFSRRVIVVESTDELKEKELKVKLAKAVEKVLKLDLQNEQNSSSVKKSQRAQARIHSADLEVDVKHLDDEAEKSDDSEPDEDELAEMRLELSKHSLLKKSIRFMSNQMLKIWIGIKGLKTLRKRRELLEFQHQRSEAKRAMFDAMVQAELDRKGNKARPIQTESNEFLKKLDAKGVDAVAKKKQRERKRLKREMQQQEEEFRLVQDGLKSTLVQYEDVSFAFFVNLVDLDCSNNFLTVLPHDIFVLTKLKKLDAHANQLRHLPVGFVGLISLRECKLSENQLMDVPSGIEKLTSLEKLSLDQNEIWEFSPDFGLFETSFKILDLANNRIGRKLGSMPALLHIKGLRLDGNGIDKFPKAMLIGQMTQLQRLSMSNNTLEVIPETLTTLQKLKYMDLSYNFIELVPRYLCRMTNLTDMRFSNCRISNVAVELCRLSQLTNLNLNGNDFILFPPIECVAGGFARVMSLLKIFDEAEGLNEFDILQINGLKLNNFPERLFLLGNLCRLNAFHNRISKIPSDFQRLMKLTEFNISENPLSNVGLTIFALTNLTDLRMSRCELSAVSQAVGKLRSLIVFDISQNRIRDIPESLFKLQHLSDCRLSDNVVEELPSLIGFATSLKVLTLHINKLATLPLSVSKLALLSVVTFSRNMLGRLPSSVGGFVSLTVLTLSNCSLQVYPSILGDGSFLLLRELWLSHNFISSIPSEIKKLVRLEQLWLNNNQLTYIHRDLRTLSIKILSLYGNMALEVPDFIRSMNFEIFYDVDSVLKPHESAESFVSLLKPSK